MKATIILSILCILLYKQPVAAAGLHPVFADTVGKSREADAALVNKFREVCKGFGSIKNDYTLAGVINIKDPAVKPESVKFTFCKQRDEFYYLLGKTITLNGKGSYVVIDNQAHSILLSAQKKIEYGADNLKQLTAMADNIRSENYQVTSTIKGQEQTISLVNEHHISCKQYTVTFNRSTLKVSHLYMRLSDFSAPLKKEKDKIVDVAITQWARTADLQKYLTPNQVIVNKNGTWKGLNQYKNYRITIL
ncbi:hypothetical protein ACEN9X_22525 [Mucilaginibacter sp. Mucisp86]|uniref:hypothetical protein n=1 Tax=Mucilaginibacter sp. Mucisp86 TaxID=3243060 RepID=UPI0039B5D4C9